MIRKTNTGIKFDLKAGNGEVIAVSEGCTAKASNGIESVKKNAPDAAIEEQAQHRFFQRKRSCL